MAVFKQISAINDENLAETYSAFPSISMDNGLAEVAEKVAVVPVNMAWSDLGSWDSIYQRQKKDAQNNVIHGDVLTQDTQNSLIWTESGLIATLGLSNIAVIQTADANVLLRCQLKRGESVCAAHIQNFISVCQMLKDLTDFHVHDRLIRPGGGGADSMFFGLGSPEVPNLLKA